MFGTDKDRFKMFRNIDNLIATLPKGGDFIWNDSKAAPNPEYFCTFEFGNGDYVEKKSTQESIKILFNQLLPERAARLNESYSYGIAKTAEELDANKDSSKYWSNPLETTLPNAKSTTIYLLYGINQVTAGSFQYKCKYLSRNRGFPLCRLKSVTSPNIIGGIHTTNGDGAVPLISNGLLGVHGWWKGKSIYNPWESPVVVREYAPSHYDDNAPIWESWKRPGGGFNNAAHVDILGSLELIEDLLGIATDTSLYGRSNVPLTSRIVSGISDKTSNLKSMQDN